jgi:hypothetical protein
MLGNFISFFHTTSGGTINLAYAQCKATDPVCGVTGGAGLSHVTTLDVAAVLGPLVGAGFPVCFLRSVAS